MVVVVADDDADGGGGWSRARHVAVERERGA
jgi:hypothetical protein